MSGLIDRKTDRSTDEPREWGHFDKFIKISIFAFLKSFSVYTCPCGR